LSQSFKARLWNERRSVKELEASLIETQQRAAAVQKARSDVPDTTGVFEARVSVMRGRMDDMQVRLAEMSALQSRYLSDLAVHELQDQKRRIEVYQVQARYELAAIYDKTTNGKSKARP
jgi:predicted  nucleic acid-binding Zn-ribbon protein